MIGVWLVAVVGAAGGLLAVLRAVGRADAAVAAAHRAGRDLAPVADATRAAEGARRTAAGHRRDLRTRGTIPPER